MSTRRIGIMALVGLSAAITLALAAAGLATAGLGALAPSVALAQAGGKPALTWSAPVFIQKPPYEDPIAINNVSCATASLCVVSDGQNLLGRRIADCRQHQQRRCRACEGHGE